jgi:hypothetical protein
MQHNGLDQARGYLGALDLLARSRAECERSQILRADIANQQTVALRWRAKGLVRRRQCSLGEAYDGLLVTDFRRLQKCEPESGDRD